MRMVASLFHIFLGTSVPARFDWENLDPIESEGLSFMSSADGAARNPSGGWRAKWLRQPLVS